MNPLAPDADAGRQTLVDTNRTRERQNVSTATWRIVLLASLGGALEFYDFVIFGVFAKDIADAIFPNPTPLISLNGVVCRVRRWLSGASPRWHRAQPLRRSLR